MNEVKLNPPLNIYMQLFYINIENVHRIIKATISLKAILQKEKK